MEIEFNPNRLANTPVTPPAAASHASVSSGDSVSMDKISALKTAINNISLVRPEKVDAARALVADSEFPPDHMLKAIASLIAEKMQ